MLIYHIVLPEDWEKFAEEYEYEAASLDAEGFIHCSYRNQLDDVLQRYYSNADKVLILQINPHLLKSELIAEPSTNGEIYPHIYGKINKSAVVAVEKEILSTDEPEINTDIKLLNRIISSVFISGSSVDK